jgi:RNA 2',3'-cyclic 3'-phosphodiesterase
VTGPDRVRLFVAVTVPDERLRSLASDVEGLPGEVGGRWTDIENQHVTLKFLGSVPSELISKLEEILGAAASAEKVSDLSLAGLGAFPSRKRARVLWAGIEDEREVLTRLAATLDEALEPLGFAPEQRAFTPHLTLARFKTPQRLPDLPLLGDASRESFPARSIVLFRSHLSPRGARYEALSDYPLQPA